MSWTLTTSQAILFKAGKNVSDSTATSGGLMMLASDFAEAAIARDTRHDWVTNYATVIANLKPTLSDAASDYAGKFLINRDMSGYTNSGEAVTMVNILIDNYIKNITRIKDENIQSFMQGVN